MKRLSFFILIFIFSLPLTAGRKDALTFKDLKLFIPSRGVKSFLEEGMPEEVKASYCNTAFGRYDYPDRMSTTGVESGIIEITVSDCYKLNGCSIEYLKKILKSKKKFAFRDCYATVYFERKYGNHIEYFIPVTKRTHISLVLYDTKYISEVEAIFRKIPLEKLRILAINRHRDE